MSLLACVMCWRGHVKAFSKPLSDLEGPCMDLQGIGRPYKAIESLRGQGSKALTYKVLLGEVLG